MSTASRRALGGGCCADFAGNSQLGFSGGATGEPRNRHPRVQDAGDGRDQPQKGWLVGDLHWATLSGGFGEKNGSGGTGGSHPDNAFPEPCKPGSQESICDEKPFVRQAELLLTMR